MLVARAKGQAGELVAGLTEAGAEPVEVPLIKIVPPRSWEALDRAIDELPGGYDWLIFTSANAARCFLDRLEERGKGLEAIEGMAIAAIGPATAKSLEKRGVAIDYRPKEAVAESVVEGFEELGVTGKRFLIPRAEVAREVIPEELAKLGGLVDVAEVYRTVPNEEAAPELKRLFAKGEIDAVMLTSSSTAKNLVAILGNEAKSMLEGVAIAAIGPVTADIARELGLDVAVVAVEFTGAGLLDALINYVTERRNNVRE